MMLQNNCLNNGVTNGLNKGKKKSMQTVLHGKIKERKNDWLIGANTQDVPYLSIAATQDNTRQHKGR